jgi:hypothetical protein
MIDEVGCVPKTGLKSMCNLGVRDKAGLVCCQKECGSQCSSDEQKCGKAFGNKDVLWATANCCQSAIFGAGSKCLKPDDTSCTLAVDGNGDHTNTVPGDHAPNQGEMEADLAEQEKIRADARDRTKLLNKLLNKIHH